MSGLTLYNTTAGMFGRQQSLYDLQHPEVIADPWGWYRSLLAGRGPRWDPTVRSWLVARHADVSRVLTDLRFSAVADHTRAARCAPAALRRIYPLLDGHVSFVDPPDHTRLRGVLADRFKPRHVQALDSFIRDAIAGALDRAAAAGRMEVMADLAVPVPMLVIQRALGLDGVDVATLRRWSNAWGNVVAAPGHLPTGDISILITDIGELIGFLRQAVARCRTRPDDTLTGMLVAAADDGALSEDELIGNLMMLVTAGNETTASLIGNAVAALAQRPRLADQLRVQPDLLPTAVEELARLYPATQYTVRTARASMTISGRRVEGGQAVVLMLAAANRDPEAFPSPDTFRLDRPATPRRWPGWRSGWCSPPSCTGAPTCAWPASRAGVPTTTCAACRRCR